MEDTVGVGPRGKFSVAFGYHPADGSSFYAQGSGKSTALECPHMGVDGCHWLGFMIHESSSLVGPVPLWSAAFWMFLRLPSSKLGVDMT
jgi:hypothetical protein